MNLLLLRQDPALRALPRWLPVTVGVGTVLLGLIFNITAWLHAAYDRSLSPMFNFALLAFVIWLSVGAFLFTAASRERCSRLALTLPISPARLWVAHCFGLLISCFVILALIALLSSLLIWLLGRVIEQPMMLPGSGIVDLLAKLSAGLVLSILILQLPQRELYKIPGTRRFAAFTFAALLGGFGLVLALAQVSIVATLLPVIAAVALGIRAHRNQPAAYAFLPRASMMEAEPIAEPGLTSDDPLRAQRHEWEQQDLGPLSRLHLSALLIWTIYRGVPKARMLLLLGLPFMVLFGLAFSGLFDGMSDDLSWRWSTIFITLYMLIVLFARPLPKLYLIDTLPVSRQLIFSLLIFPSLAFIGLGYGAGRLIVDSGLLGQRSECRLATQCSGAIVSPAHLRIAWDGKPPAITTPWGESYEAWHMPLFKGSRAVLYSPYCTRDSSGADFDALQLSRAIEAIYDRPITQNEILTRYFSSGEAEESTQLELLRDYPELRTQEHGQVFPVLMFLVCVSWLAITMILLRTYRAGMGERVRKSTFVTLLVLTLALHTGQFVLIMTKLIDPLAATAFWEILCVSLAELLPGGVPTLWILSAIAVFLMYWIAQRQFARIEFPIESGDNVCWY